MTSTRELVTDQREQFAFHDDIVYLRETKRGLSRDTVEEISRTGCSSSACVPTSTS
jgi:hypothetical protein